jgi:hypothetical protein
VTDTVFIALPAFGQQNCSQTTASLIALVKELTERRMFNGFAAWTLPDIADLRDLFLTVWYDGTDASHCLMVDADIQFEPELVRDMLLADKPLCGVLYPKKRLPIEWVGSALDPADKTEGPLIELEGIGAGVLLIRRDCVANMLQAGVATVIDELGDSAIEQFLKKRGGKRIISAFQKIRQADAGGHSVRHRTLSEDFSFCHRHRQVGGKVYAVTNHAICHIGQHQYTARYADLWEKKGVDKAPNAG